MRDIIIEIFANHSRIIIFFHVISAVLLIGSLFLIRFLIVPVFDKIEQEEVRYKAYLELIKYFLSFIFVVMFILITVSVFMNVGLGLKFGDQTTYIIAHTKEIVWSIMMLNFIVMYVKYKSAQKAMKNNVLVEVHENIVLIVKYLVPANLVISLLSVYLGIIIRGF